MNRAKALKPSRTRAVEQHTQDRPAGPRKILKKSLKCIQIHVWTVAASQAIWPAHPQVRSTKWEPLGSADEEDQFPRRFLSTQPITNNCSWARTWHKEHGGGKNRKLKSHVSTAESHCQYFYYAAPNHFSVVHTTMKFVSDSINNLSPLKCNEMMRIT